MAKQSETAELEVSCDACEAMCCRYVATQIDTPSSKREYDFIRWYLLHRDVSVFIDHNGGWFIEFTSPCEMLDDSHRCSIYDKRPHICRHHGTGETECEFHGATAPHRIRFSHADAFELWLDQRKIDWRFKGHYKKPY